MLQSARVFIMLCYFVCLVECRHQYDPQTELWRHFDILLSDKPFENVTQYWNSSVKQFKFVPLANHKEHTQYSEPIKTRAGKRVGVMSRLVLVLLQIGWKIGANFLSQSCSVANPKPITFRHSNENRSKTNSNNNNNNKTNQGNAYSRSH